MKKFYDEPKVRIETPADVVTTSPEVETGRVPFFYSVQRTGEGFMYISGSEEQSYNTNGN